MLLAVGFQQVQVIHELQIIPLHIVHGRHRPLELACVHKLLQLRFTIRTYAAVLAVLSLLLQPFDELEEEGYALWIFGLSGSG
jgi:hypothetical protein